MCHFSFYSFLSKVFDNNLVPELFLRSHLTASLVLVDFFLSNPGRYCKEISIFTHDRGATQTYHYMGFVFFCPRANLPAPIWRDHFFHY